MFGFLRGGLVIVQAFLLSQVITQVFPGGIQRSISPVQIGAILTVILLRAGMAFAGETSANRTAAGIKSGLRERLGQTLADLGPVYTRGERTGELVTTAVEGVGSLEAYFGQYLPQMALAVLVPVSIFLVVFPLDPLTGLVLLLTAPLIPIFMILIAGQSEAATHRQWKVLGRLSSYFLDTLQGLVTLKLLGLSRKREEGIANNSEGYRLVTMKVLRITFLSALTLELVATISIAIVAVEVGLRVLAGGMGYPEALFILILAPEFYLPLRSLGARFHASMPAMSAAGRFKEILDVGQAHRPLGLACPGNEDKLTPLCGAGFVLQVQVQFENVFYSYPEGANDLRPALNGISFTLEPGQHVALVGPSGAGKSTIMALLLRFIEPDQGRILVAGKPLASIPAEEWRNCIAWVPQQPYLFNDTLEANLRLAKPGASIAEIETAVRQAHLDGFIRSLPEGHRTPVGEGGLALSGGQAQRLALARAFLKQASLLLLDEPTANLDPESEALFRDSIDQLGAGKTVLTIAHRLETVKGAGCILVVDGGRIVERGSHTELIARQGLYARMVESHGK